MTSTSIDYAPWMSTNVSSEMTVVAPVPESVPAPEQTTSTTSSVDSRKVRAWAISQGIPVGKRGRVKPDVIARYNEAHGA